MLSLPSKPFSAGAEAYYLTLASENYYQEGGEPLGQWFGKGAERLNLKDTVTKEVLAKLIAGRDPNGKDLVQNAGDADRAAGWDLTFSAPKSVSALWSQLDDSSRKIIQQCQMDAVHTTLSYLEETSAFSRVGKEGRQLAKADFVFAIFEHGTSRANDPQLHSHCLALNVCLREDGSSGTIYSAPFYRDKMLLGACYRVQLAYLLEQRLGLRIRLSDKTFEILGVAKELVAAFSKRRQAIVEALRERGLSGAVAAATAALDTREKKQHQPRKLLFPIWQEIGKDLGFGPEQAQQLLHQAAHTHGVAPERLATRIGKELAESRGQFTQKELLRTTLVLSQGSGRDLKEIEAGVTKALQGKAFLQLRASESGQPLFTTKALYDVERKVLAYARQSRKTEVRFGSHLIYGIAVAVWEKLPFTKKLSDEQRQAVRHITLSSGSIKLVAGAAGTGKSFMLNAARRVWELNGFKVHGAAVSGIAADNLEQSSGIRSRTVAGTLLGLEKKAIQLDRKSILVVDEAGMLSTRELLRLVEATQKKKAKLILVGDENQIQSIEAGGAFKALSESLGRAELKENRRQREAWHKKAASLIPEGKTEEALKLFDEAGRLHFGSTKKKVMAKLVSDWKEIAAKDPSNTLILAATRSDVKALNHLVQDEQLKANRLGAGATHIWGQDYHRGDRVLFTQNSKNLGVRNGHLGTVTGATPLGMLVQLDTGKVTVVPPLYRHIELGYAVTTHKAQGITVENALVLAGGTMADRELSYVQASRARGHTAIYALGERREKPLQRLAQEINRSEQKEFASEVYTHTHTQR